MALASTDGPWEFTSRLGDTVEIYGPCRRPRAGRESHQVWQLWLFDVQYWLNDPFMRRDALAVYQIIRSLVLSHDIADAIVRAVEKGHLTALHYPRVAYATPTTRPPKSFGEAEWEQWQTNRKYPDPFRAEAASTAVDATPVIGTLKSAGQIVTGTEGFTGKKLDRFYETLGTALSVIPGGKTLLKSSSKTAEVLGEAGGEQALKRQGIVTDPGFTERYHGQDHLGRDRQGLLTETEYKGTKNGNTKVATDVEGYKQGSAKKNLKRADFMLKKKNQGKVGVPSNRIGGPYTEEEMNLYQEIYDNEGQKRHLSTHTNTETGQVRTFTRDNEGGLGDQIDEFQLENFEELKQSLLKKYGI